MKGYMFILVIVISSELGLSLQDADGVCYITEMRNVSREVTTEVITGTTEIPCKANSWIDELSCMNRRIKTKNVTEVRQIMVTVEEPVTIKLCCVGYVQVDDGCQLVSTIPTSRRHTTIPATHSTTTETRHVPLTNTITVTTIGTLQTTTAIPDKRQTTSEQETSQRKLVTTHRKLNTAKTGTSTLSSNNDVTMVRVKLTTTEPNRESNKIDINGKHSDNTVLIPGINTTVNASPNDIDIKNILLYISAVCGLVSVFVMVLVVFICYRKNRKTRQRSHTPVLTMDTIQMGRNGRVWSTQAGSECAMRNQNAKNVYTELRLTGDYDDIKGIEEDPYEELPDEYQDCDASPRLSKTSQDHYYEVSKF